MARLQLEVGVTTVGDERQLEEAAQAAVQSQVATDVRRLLREQPKQQRPEPHEHDSAVACSCLLALPGRGAQVQQTRTRTGYVLFTVKFLTTTDKTDTQQTGKRTPRTEIATHGKLYFTP